MIPCLGQSDYRYLYTLSGLDRSKMSPTFVFVVYISQIQKDNLSSTWVRTTDLMVNSHTLYQLSHRGLFDIDHVLIHYYIPNVFPKDCLLLRKMQKIHPADLCRMQRSSDNPRWDSSPQPLDAKSNALFIAPLGRRWYGRLRIVSEI
jgi:hypothetical protein